MTSTRAMSDSIKLSIGGDGETATVWLYRLEDGTIHLSEVRSPGDREGCDIPRGRDLMISRTGLDRLVFALLADRFRGRTGIIEEMRAILVADQIPYALETYT